MKANIKILLDKYFDGATSLAEEQTLRTYFAGSEIDAEFLPFQSLFQFFNEEQEVRLSADFEAIFLANIEPKQKAKVVQMRPKQSRKTWLRAAAAIALLIGAFWMAQLYVQPPAQTASRYATWENAEVKDQKKALEEATKALKFLAKAFNKSAKKAASGMNKTGKATKIFQ